MTLTSVPEGDRARLDGRVVATDLDRALEMLVNAERLRSEAAALLADLQHSGLEEFCGYASWERLVAHRTRCGNRDAAAVLRVARHLDRFPATAAMLASGAITVAHVDVLARTAAGLTAAYRRSEAELLRSAGRMEPDELGRVGHLWRERADAAAATERAEHRHGRRGLWMQHTLDGSCRGRFELDPIGADLVARALETRPDSTSSVVEPRSRAQRRADRLVDLCQASLSSQGDPDAPAGGGVRAHVDVVLDVETLAGADGPVDRIRAELGAGGPIAGPALDRLLCDASFRALITDGPRVVLAYNRATPDIPPGLRCAVRIRDHHCTFDGCDRPWQWCDLHHIVPRNRGGPTTAENLTMLCRFHHGLVHEGGWQLSRAPDGSIELSTP